MNYLRHYYNIVNRAFLQKRKRSNEIYYEGHHVKPKSLGGSGRIVLLTAKEHFIAHFLLYKYFKHNKHNKNALIKMSYAFNAMTCNKNGKRYTTRSFKIAREEHCKNMLGENNPFFGKIHSKETRRKLSQLAIGREITVKTREKISQANRGNTHTEETIAKIVKFHIGKKRSHETRNKMSQAAIGKIISDKTKQKMSDSHTGKMWIKNIKTRECKIVNPSELEYYFEIGFVIGRLNIKCPHCQKEGNIANIKRYHFNNCKFKK